MRSGNWRGLAVAIALAGAAVLCGPGTEARADGLFHHTIPRETLALDYRTGDVMMAPPIPYGCYAKDYAGAVHGAAGMTFGAVHGLVGKLHGAGGILHGLCSKCGGKACGLCGGLGRHGNNACGGCGGDGCSRCGSGLGGLFHHGNGSGVGGLFHHGNGALGHLGHNGGGMACVGAGCGTLASAQVAGMPAPPVKVTGPTPAPQAVASGQQIDPVCGGCLGTGHLVSGRGCGLCGGSGRLRNLLGHGGAGLGHGQVGGDVCGGCGGRGCGLCGGRGHLGHGGNGPCRGCGGRGCGLCAGLKGKASMLLGLPMGLASKITHKGQVQYFVGPGGPVPITPGYVPYVNVTRSPRDFLAFPPFSDQIP